MSSAVKRSISPLQARMIEDMTARKLSPKTQTAHQQSHWIDMGDGVQCQSTLFLSGIVAKAFGREGVSELVEAQ